MAEVVYVLVDADGEPHLWGPEGEANIEVYGDFWRAWRAPGAKKGKEIRALSLEDLKSQLQGRWSHVTHVMYIPGADGYQVARETIFETY